MSRPSGLLGIAYCYFSVHRTTGQRQFSTFRFFVFGILPFCAGLALFLKFGPPETGNLGLVAAVMSVVSAVLLGLLPLSHGIVGQCDTERKYTEGEFPLAEEELNRIRTLQDLQSAISWAVILLVVGLVACVVISLLPRSSQEPSMVVHAAWTWILWICSGIMYAVMTSTVMSFFDVATGVFEGMENHAEAVKRSIGHNMIKGGKAPSDRNTRGDVDSRRY